MFDIQFKNLYLDIPYSMFDQSMIKSTPNLFVPPVYNCLIDGR